MTTVVIMPGGFHPFHAGHAALYQSARRAFPDADVKVAATNDISSRPFPFAVKEKLAQLAGVAPGNFYQVKSPFRAEEITKNFNPDQDVVIFIRSEKDAGKPPMPGGTKKDGTPGYLQPLIGAKKLEPFARHAYMAYLPTVEFGPGMTSATEIRTAWPQLNEKRKTALVMSLYPATQTNPKLAATVVKMLDTAMGSETQGVAEGTEQITELRDRMYQYIRSIVPTWPEYIVQDWLYKGRGKNKNYTTDSRAVKDEIIEMIADAGLSPNTNPWQLVPNMKFTTDMFEPKSKRKLIGRAGGTSDMGMGIPKDAERHATQAALIQQGGVSREPAILIKFGNGYELLEGWHRTIQHFVKYPDGYTGPAYVAVAQGQQGVAEDAENFNGIDISVEVEDDEIMVRARANGRELGHVLFVENGEYLLPQDLEVDERFRGQGIAQTMYDYVKSKGYKIRRSGQQTDAGAGFWNKHRAAQNVWEQDDSEGKSYDFIAGHCHVMALALKQLHPDWQIRAHVGWDDDAADDAEYRVDHVYTVAPDGTAYDCRGKFSNEEQLVGPDATGGVDTQYVNFGPKEIKQAMLRGELKRFTKQDLDNAMQVGKQVVAENNTAAGINKMFNNLGDPVFSNLQRIALLAMQGRQQEASGRLQLVIKDASPTVQKKIIDAVNSIKPVTINGKIADSSTIDKSKQHQDWIINTFIPWVQSLLGQQGVAEGEGGLGQVAGIGINGKQFNFSIKDLIAKAQNYPIKKLNPQLFVKQLADRHEDPKQTAARAQSADLQYPIIVVQDGNTLMIADGTHRAQKAIMNKLPAINAHVIPVEDMAEFVKQGVAENADYLDESR